MDLLVTYNAQGGVFWDGSTSKQFSYPGSTYTSTIVERFNDNKPTKEGYTFDDWWTYPDNQYSISDQGTRLANWGHYTLETLYPETNEITIYAHWKSTTFHTITFDGNGGIPSVSSITTNNLIITLPNASLSGWSIIAWYSNKTGGTSIGKPGDTYIISGDQTIYAQWSPNQHTITFYSNGGSEISPISALYGQNITPPANPIREGYVFQGWVPDLPETMPDEDIICTAQWEAIPSEPEPIHEPEIIETNTASPTPTGQAVTITFNENTETPRVFSITTSSSLILPGATRRGYNLDGWYTQETGGTRIGSQGQLYTVSESMTLYAHWVAVQYSISYDLNGHGSLADGTKTQYTVQAETYAPPAPNSAPGFQFTGWTPEKIETGSIGNKTFAANWRKISNIESETRIDDIAICCIGTSGNSDMNDWVKHHIGLGIDHIYIYNNGSVKNVLNILDTDLLPKVTLVDFPYNYEKEYAVSAYADCYRKHRSQYGWMMFIDPGEFLILPSNNSIKDILCNKRYREFEVIRVNIVQFSNHKRLMRDFALSSGDEGTSNDSKLARTILNCNTKGLLMGKYSPRRNGESLVQCLPNLEPVKDDPRSTFIKGAGVAKTDISTMYLTPNKLEVLWVLWKKEKAKGSASTLNKTNKIQYGGTVVVPARPIVV